MDLALIIAAVPVGLVVGGFVTMLVDRIPDATPLTTRSRCPHCEHPLGWFDVVPVLSWFVLRGRCRHCGTRITPAYPVVEIVTAALFLAVAIRFDADWVVIPPLIFATALMGLSVIDIYVYRLPDRLMFPSILVSIVAIVAVSIAIDRPGAIGRALAGMVGYAGVMFIAHLISPRGLAFGDVKLALLLGLHVGWAAGITYVGWRPVFVLVLYALLLGHVLGVVSGLTIGVARRAGHDDVVVDPEAVDGQPAELLKNTFPFGPSLAAGAMVVVLFSANMLST